MTVETTACSTQPRNTADKARLAHLSTILLPVVRSRACACPVSERFLFTTLSVSDRLHTRAPSSSITRIACFCSNIAVRALNLALLILHVFNSTSKCEEYILSLILSATSCRSKIFTSNNAFSSGFTCSDPYLSHSIGRRKSISLLHTPSASPRGEETGGCWC